MKIIKLCFFFMLWVFTQHTYASCSGTTGVMSINVGTITIPVDAPNSTATYYYNDTKVIPQSVRTNANLNCTNSSYMFTGHIQNPVPGTNYLEKLMLSDGQWSGLGIKFYNTASNGWWNVFNMLSPPASVQSSNWNKYCFTADCWNHTGDMTVVQSGNIGITGSGVPVIAGPFNTRINGVYTADGYDAMDFIISGTIVTPSCNVNALTPSQVKLDPRNSWDFAAKGETSGDTPFEIRLDCSGQAEVNLLLDGQEDTDATGKGVLAIKDTALSAKGIGIQLLYNNQPVELEKKFTVGTSTGNTFTIPMTARYYRTTEAPVKAGDVSATVVYSLTYK